MIKIFFFKFYFILLRGRALQGHRVNTNGEEMSGIECMMGKFQNNLKALKKKSEDIISHHLDCNELKEELCSFQRKKKHNLESDQSRRSKLIFGFHTHIYS